MAFIFNDDKSIAKVVRIEKSKKNNIFQNQYTEVSIGMSQFPSDFNLDDYVILSLTQWSKTSDGAKQYRTALFDSTNNRVLPRINYNKGNNSLVIGLYPDLSGITEIGATLVLAKLSE